MSNDLIITGLPRSGTSFLCTRLNSIADTVIINEPSEIPLALRNENNIINIELVYDNFRTAILNRTPIPNKIKDGKFIEDTAGADSRQLYTPDFETADFLLGIKNTMIFLANLDRIIEELPHIKIIGTIRHPLDTIGSWMNVPFEHLNNAKPGFLFDKVNEITQRKLAKIENEPDLEKRMAMLWRFLAKQLHDARHKIQILRYEDLISDESDQLNRIACTLDLGVPFQPSPTKNKIRKRSASLSARQIGFAQKACAEIAHQFSYKL